MENPRIVWMTGATSGIGKALTARFLLDGWRVAVTGRDSDRLLELARLHDGTEILPLAADVADPAEIADAYARLKQTWGVPDMVIANAGTHINMPASRLRYEDCRTLFAVNLHGAVATLLAGLPDMMERGSGHLVGVGSLSSYRGLPLAAAYGATKAGLNNFLQSLRFDVETHGIRVSAVNPGFVKTPLTDRNDFPMPFIVSAEKAADYIARGLARGKMEIHFPPALSWPFKLLRILPYPLYHALIRRATGSRRRKG